MADQYGIEGHKLIYHPKRVAQLINGEGDWERIKQVYPIYLEISPIGACNHRCSFCAVDYVGYNPVRLDMEVLKVRLPEMGKLGVKSIMYAGEGEPLLHKQIAEMAELSKQSGIDVAFTTNATVLPKDFLERALPNTSWIKASINAGTAKTYSHIHQTKEADFFKAIEHLKAMVEYREKHNLEVTLGAQSLLLPDNVDEMRELAMICRDQIGLDYLVVKPYSQHTYSETHLYEDVDYSQFVGLKEELDPISTDRFQVIFREKTMRKYVEGNNNRYQTCYSTPNLWAYVMADGRVFSCSAYLLDEKFDLGNINNHTFQEVWQGERRMRNLEHVLHGLDISQCRVNCRMDEANRFLDAVKEQNVAHVNFI